MEEKSYLKIGSLRIHRAWIMLVACCFLATGYLGMLFGPNGNFYVAIAADTGWFSFLFLKVFDGITAFGWRKNLRCIYCQSG